MLERGESMYVFLLEKEECESVSLIERGKCVREEGERVCMCERERGSVSGDEMIGKKNNELNVVVLYLCRFNVFKLCLHTIR